MNKHLRYLAALIGLVLVGRAEAQQAPTAPGFRPLRFGGQVTMGGELYHRSQGVARRPGSSGRVLLTPYFTLLGDLTVGLNILLSTEGSQLNQNLSQFGVSPGWRWGTLHLGDFSQNFSPYTVQGTRLRGAGVDLHPGNVRFALQGGRALRAVTPGTEVTAFQRNLVAGKAGFGDAAGSLLNLTFVWVKDDASSVEGAFLLPDTILLDTIPEDLRPAVDTRPQQNTVVGLEGQLSLLDDALVLKGEYAAAMVTVDNQSAEIDLERGDLQVPGPVASVLGIAHARRLSTSADHAYKVEADWRRGPLRVAGGYERIGTGYSSLGLPYLINDREAYHANGSVRLFANRLTLQGRFRHQQNNLTGQKEATIARNSLSASVAYTASANVVTTVTAVLNSATNDAAVPEAMLDNTSLALVTTTAVRTSLFGRPSAVSMGYNLQRTTDGNPISQIPNVTVHNVTTSVQIPISATVSLAPSVSGAFTHVAGQELQHNVFLGFRGTGRLLDGKLRTSATVSRTFSSGREVTQLGARVSYPVTWGTTVALRARHSRFATIGTREGFTESFLNLTITRGF